MADVTITAANLRPGNNAVINTVTAGETITAGQPVYKNTADANNEYFRCDADVQAAAVCAGIAITNAGDGEKLQIQTSGELIIGGTLAVGVYCVSTNVGGVAPVADVVSGDFVTILGIAISTTILKMGIQVGGAAVA